MSQNTTTISQSRALFHAPFQPTIDHTDKAPAHLRLVQPYISFVSVADGHSARSAWNGYQPVL